MIDSIDDFAIFRDEDLVFFQRSTFLKAIMMRKLSVQDCFFLLFLLVL